MTSGWYEVVSGEDLEQGDLVSGLPLPRVVGDPYAPDGPVVAVSTGDFVVLSQTCDLVNGKVREVLFAGVMPYRELAAKNSYAASSAFQKALAQEAHIAYWLLAEHSDMPQLEWSCVSFHHLHLIDKDFCRQFVARAGDRLRLTVPYREALAQSFGRYMMRVAYPETTHAFLKDAPAIVKSA